VFLEAANDSSTCKAKNVLNEFGRFLTVVSFICIIYFLNFVHLLNYEYDHKSLEAGSASVFR
jgi:hypothetical protein